MPDECRECAGTAGLQVTMDRVIAIGTSTGGTQALEEIQIGLPPTLPGIVVVQHMPEKFTAAFAVRLNEICAVEVREAAQGDRVLPLASMAAAIVEFGRRS